MYDSLMPGTGPFGPPLNQPLDIAIILYYCPTHSQLTPPPGY